MNTRDGFVNVDVPRQRSGQLLEVDGWAFSNTPQLATEEELKGVIDWDRARGIEITDPALGTPGTLVAAHSSHKYDMRVPGGGAVATSGLTWVGVHPAFRRRGLLTRMIDDHFERAQARGESISTLYAAETAIYQRFGYGGACQSYAMSTSRAPSLRDIAGSDDLRLDLENASLERHAAVVRAVLARITRPGAHATIDEPLMRDLFLDPELWREGAERLRFAVVRDHSGPAAFAIFSRKLEWSDGAPDGEFMMRTWAAATGAAERRLLAVLLDLDLIAKVTMRNIAADDPLVLLLKDIRGAKLTVRDNIWVRVLDLPVALGARGYHRDADVTIKVTDAQLPANAGLWRLRISGGNADVTRVAGATPDITIPIQELGAIYLGGVRLQALANAGLVEGNADAIAAASDAFAGDQLPVSPVSF